MIDGGATHNFIDASLVTMRHIPREEFEGFNVVVVYGYNMTCTKRIRGLNVILGKYTLTNDFYVVYLVDTMLSPIFGITKDIMYRGPQVADMECRETT